MGRAVDGGTDELHGEGADEGGGTCPGDSCDRDGGVVGVSGVPPCQQEERREQSDTVCRVGGGDPVEPWCAVGEMVHPFEQAVIQFVLSFQTPSAVTVARVVRRVIESSR